MVPAAASFISLSPLVHPWASYRQKQLTFCRASSLSLLLSSRLCSFELSKFFPFGLKQRTRGLTISAKKSPEASKQDVGRYKYTIDLPKTTFDLRANSIVREPEIQKFWEDNEVFQQNVNKNKGGTFILHDGPPYANGKLHMGHALNKILKDIINRYKLLQNYKVQFVPGWDCHGLPIELKVLQSIDQATRKNLTPLALREKAAKFAKETVDLQMKSFKRYGVWADWTNSYLTLSPEYEAAQIEVFGQMVTKGYIYRGRKPVHWSPSSRTALAEAELEFPDDHVSKSIYVVLKMVSSSPSSHDLLEEFLPNLWIAIWTTTPWTIPANAAVAINPALVYSVVKVHSALDEATVSPTKLTKLANILNNGEKKPFFIVASNLVPTLESKWGVKLIIKKTFLGIVLENCRYLHPVNGKECPVVLGGDYITTESGTGLVHTAPGHGQEDYTTGLKYGLPIFSPVDDNGNFTEEAGQFSGLNVLGDGNTAVVRYLDDMMLLLLEEPYKHKYPYDWRTKKPTIFRSTEQWFASVDGFRQASMDAINMVNWVPPQAVNRIIAMTASRSDWCISRQRTWGVPIPVFYHVDTKEPLITEETISHIKAIISNRGSDAWWYLSTEKLLPENFCSSASKYQRGTDTMDVWFDSGSSWAAVLGKRKDLSLPADLYLEGSDQHRGWFQSSLLTSIATTGKPPYSCVVTHGFVLDEKGLKMSKSLGNIVDPEIVISGKSTKDKPAYGADVLRLWVSSVDYTGDVLIGPQILRQMSDIYRKLRGTLRFLLSNLHDWNPGLSIVYDDLPKIDQHALFQLENVVKIVTDAFDNFQFYKIFQILQRFAIVDLSSFYFDVAKDRLYVGGSASFTRRCCQTVLSAHFLSIVRMIAPILPHLAEDAWQNLPFEHVMEDGSVAKSVFDLRWLNIHERWLSLPATEVDFWGSVLELRSEVNRVLEVARGGKLIGSSLEAKVYLYTSDSATSTRLRKMCEAGHEADCLHRIIITSQVEVLTSLDEVAQTVDYSASYIDQANVEIWIGICRADGTKCERCWNYSPGVGLSVDHPTLCPRCCTVVSASQPLQVAAQVC